LWQANPLGLSPLREKDVFFHQEACEAGAFETLKAGDKVTFDVEQAEKGPRAINVKLAA